MLNADEIFLKAKKLPTRKEQAKYILDSAPYIKSIVFNMLDGRMKEASTTGWKLCKPERHTFSVET